MSSDVDVDAVVVGGGPAGAAAALALARGGARVALVERCAYPRDKVCGDLLGSDAVAALRRLGLAETALAGATPVSGALLRGPDGYEAGGDATASLEPVAWVQRRETLDARLAAAAREAGAGLVRATATALLRDGTGRVAGVAVTAGGGAAAIRAPAVVVADGWRSRLVAQRPPGSAAARTAVAIRGYAADAGDLGGRMRFTVGSRDDGYGWVFPLGERGANVGLGFILAEAPRPALRAAFDRFAAAHVAGPVERIESWPIPLGPAAPAGEPGCFVAGDAAWLASPISGSGIALALRSGAAAGAHALDALAGDGRAWRRYVRWLASQALPRLAAERAVHRLAATPGRVGPWLRLARAVPGGGALLARGMLALG